MHVCGRQRMNLDAPQELPLLFSKGLSLAWSSPHRQGWSKPKVPPASTSPVLGYKCVHYTQLFFTWVLLGIELTELSHLASAQKVFQKLRNLMSDLWNLLSTKYFFQLRQHFSILNICLLKIVFSKKDTLEKGYFLNVLYMLQHLGKNVRCEMKLVLKKYELSSIILTIIQWVNVSMFWSGGAIIKPSFILFSSLASVNVSRSWVQHDMIILESIKHTFRKWKICQDTIIHNASNKSTIYSLQGLIKGQILF